MIKEMARRTTQMKGRGNQKKSFLGIVFLVFAVLIVVGLIFLLPKLLDKQNFSRSTLDEYIKVTKKNNLLNDGASVYVDMSSGMISAYSTLESKKLLESIINKLAANNSINFYSLANEEIRSVEMEHTQLYNYMLNAKSYNMQKAPIEKTLAKIITEQKPAVLMTDYEEYKGYVIEQAAYAKRYFIEWLEQGFSISFYKWDFIENKKNKSMFITVFDDCANRLNEMVGNALKTINPNIPTFVLAGRDFAYPVMSNYISLRQGGNYHTATGEDIVTAVVENGDSESYIAYSRPKASANGEIGTFAPLDQVYGTLAEYYPIGVNWKDAIKNARMMQEEGIDEAYLYTHLFRNLYIDFATQDGYKIDNIEARVFDMSIVMEKISSDSITQEELKNISMPEVNMFLNATMLPTDNYNQGVREICIDFDDKFTGTFMNNVEPSSLFKVNIVISKATPKLKEATSFFEWEGNVSLANSVKEALTAPSCSPQGRILYTYYIKTISK